jgi:hypothetical protein
MADCETSSGWPATVSSHDREAPVGLELTLIAIGPLAVPPVGETVTQSGHGFFTVQGQLVLLPRTATTFSPPLKPKEALVVVKVNPQAGCETKTDEPAIVRVHDRKLVRFGLTSMVISPLPLPFAGDTFTQSAQGFSTSHGQCAPLPVTLTIALPPPASKSWLERDSVTAHDCDTEKEWPAIVSSQDRGSVARLELT